MKGYSSSEVFLSEIYFDNQEQIESPLWRIIDGELVEPKYIHDFERYIPDELKYGWVTLSKQTKTALYVVAKEAADKEIWD